MFQDRPRRRQITAKVAALEGHGPIATAVSMAPYAPAYQEAVADVSTGLLGPLDQTIDVVPLMAVSAPGGGIWEVAPAGLDGLETRYDHAVATGRKDVMKVERDVLRGRAEGLDPIGPGRRWATRRRSRQLRFPVEIYQGDGTWAGKPAGGER